MSSKEIKEAKEAVKESVQMAIDALIEAESYLEDADILHSIETRKQEKKYDRLVLANDLVVAARRALQLL